MSDAWNEQQVFLRARALAGADREAWLKASCTTPEQRASIDSLLRLAEATIDPAAWSASSTDAADDAGLPRLLDDRYELLEELGGGGQGLVYRAHDHQMDRIVAVKMLRGDFSHSPEALARLRDEAVRAGRLSHQAIVPVHDASLHRRPFYLVTEYVPGRTLAQRLAEERELRRDGRGMPAAQWTLQVLDWLIAIAEALDHVHREGLVHRDVKPSNILLDPQRGARLTDFGVAKAVASPGVTATGGIVGTCWYMSPEQAEASATPVDARSDIFSLGAVLYEALSLERAFGGDSVVEVLRSVREARPVRLCRRGRFPRDLEVVCHKSLEKIPQDRYWSAGQVAAELRCVRSGAPILASPPSIVRRTTRWARRHRTLALSSVAGAALVAPAAVLLTAWMIERAQACRLTVRTDPPGATVLVAPIAPDEDLPAAFERLGTAPVLSARLPAGRYRLQAHLEDGRFAECDVRFARASQEAARHLVLRASPEPLGDLPPVRIETAVHDLGSDALEGPLQARRRVELPAFEIDVVPVSNREYLRFLRAQHPPLQPPSFWPAEPSEEFLDRPAVRLLPEEMEAYAAWRGMRLPSASEWEAAYRGGTRRRFPWGDDAPASWPAPSEEDRRAARGFDEPLLLTLFLRHVPSIQVLRADASSATPEGVAGLIGAVQEATSTWDLATGEVIVTKGAAWLDHWSTADPALAIGHPARAASYLLGFRCARSAASAPDRSPSLRPDIPTRSRGSP